MIYLITTFDNNFEGISQKQTKLGNKMQVETFIFRMKALDTYSNIYIGIIDNKRNT